MTQIAPPVHHYAAPAPRAPVRPFYAPNAERPAPRYYDAPPTRPLPHYVAARPAPPPRPPPPPQYYAAPPRPPPPQYYAAPPRAPPPRHYDAPAPPGPPYYHGAARHVARPPPPPYHGRYDPRGAGPRRVAPVAMPRFDLGRGKGAPPRAREADIVPMCFKCGWRNCRRVHPRRCLGAGGPCAVCGMTSHATRYHDEFEAYIRERRPRPPTEPEGEEIEAMMTALGLNSPPAAARALPAPGLAVAEPVGLDFDAPRFPNWPEAAPAPPAPAPRAFTPTPFLLTPGSVSTPPPPRREIDEPPTPYRPEPAAEAYAAPPPLPSLPTEEGL